MTAECVGVSFGWVNIIKWTLPLLPATGFVIIMRQHDVFLCAP